MLVRVVSLNKPNPVLSQIWDNCPVSVKTYVWGSHMRQPDHHGWPARPKSSLWKCLQNRFSYGFPARFNLLFPCTCSCCKGGKWRSNGQSKLSDYKWWLHLWTKSKIINCWRSKALPCIQLVCSEIDTCNCTYGTAPPIFFFIFTLCEKKRAIHGMLNHVSNVASTYTVFPQILPTGTKHFAITCTRC